MDASEDTTRRLRSADEIAHWLAKEGVDHLRSSPTGVKVYFAAPAGAETAGGLWDRCTMSVQTSRAATGRAAFAETAIQVLCRCVYPPELGYDADVVRHGSAAALFAHIADTRQRLEDPGMWAAVMAAPAQAKMMADHPGRQPGSSAAQRAELLAESQATMREWIADGVPMPADMLANVLALLEVTGFEGDAAPAGDSSTASGAAGGGGAAPAAAPAAAAPAADPAAATVAKTPGPTALADAPQPGPTPSAVNLQPGLGVGTSLPAVDAAAAAVPTGQLAFGAPPASGAGPTSMEHPAT